MRSSVCKVTAVSLILALASMAVNAAPVLGPDGHYYEVIPADSIDWDEANTRAGSEELKNQWGIAGHLATLTSQEERDFVEDLRQASGLGEVWIGGYQEPDQEEPDEGWKWVSEDGINDPTDITDFYWHSGEPNDGNGTENNRENHLAIGRYDDGSWNDEGVALRLIDGFVVEYSGTVDASQCIDGSGTVCNPSGAQTVELPAEIKLPEGATITQLLVKPRGAAVDCPGSEYAFLDPRVDPVSGRVNGAAAALDVFGDQELILPAHQFGSPCFAVVKGGANFVLKPELLDDGVLVVGASQEPEVVPDIGQTFECLSAANPDLQTTTQFGYQTDNRLDMVEEAGAAMTTGCNSPSRGLTFRFSYFVLNTHEDCGIPYDSAGGPAAIQQCFNDLAVEYFDSLEVALFAASPNLLKPAFSKLTSKLNQARSMTKTGKYARSNQRLEDLLALVEGGTWDASDERNDPGNLSMRINNLLFRNDQLEEAESILRLADSN